MQVVIDTLLTHYETEGTGKLVVILHGWGDSSDGFKRLQKSLAQRHKVTVLDLPGFGKTQAPHQVWGLDDYAVFVAHFLKKIDAGPVKTLVGHSNGGAIVIRGLAKGTLRADRLVLIASAGIRGVYKGRVKVLRYITKAGKALTMPLPNSIKRRLRQKVYKTIGSDMLVAEHLQETFKKVISDDVRLDARKLLLPTLLLYGEDDTETPVWYGETFHELITGSTLTVLPNAGHFVHLDRAADAERLIGEFVR